MKNLKTSLLILSVILAKNGLSQSLSNGLEQFQHSTINNQISYKPESTLNRQLTALDFPPNAKFSLFDASGKRLIVSKSIAMIAAHKLPKGFYRLNVYCLTGSWTIEIKEQD